MPVSVFRKSANEKMRRIYSFVGQRTKKYVIFIDSSASEREKMLYLFFRRSADKKIRRIYSFVGQRMRKHAVFAHSQVGDK